MDSFDLVIRGGTVVTSSETSRCDVGIRGGRQHHRHPLSPFAKPRGKCWLPA